MAAAAAPTSRPRQRSKMKPAEIADMLRPLVTKKSWIKYVQSPAEKLDIHAMVKCDRIVAHMATRQPNLSFARRGMREGLTMILDEHLASGTWGMTKEQGADWVVDIEQRLRTLCRHFQQAMLRKPRPSWLRRMPSATGLAAPRDSAAGDNGDESPLGDGSAADGGASVPDDDLFRDNEALKGGCDWVVPHYEESSDDGGEPRKNYFFGWCPELRKGLQGRGGQDAPRVHGHAFACARVKRRPRPDGRGVARRLARCHRGYHARSAYDVSRPTPRRRKAVALQA